MLIVEVVGTEHQISIEVYPPFQLRVCIWKVKLGEFVDYFTLSVVAIQSR
jgi:hypothetical protein